MTKPRPAPLIEAIIAAAARAGHTATVTLTRRGHLRVHGPAGLAVVAVSNRSDFRAHRNTTAQLRRYAGIEL